MNYKLSICLALLFGSLQTTSIISSEELTCQNNCSISKNTWLPRAFCSYSIHDILQQQYVYTDSSNIFGNKNINLSIFTEYMQSFGAQCGDSCKNLASMPFWSGTNTMTVGNNDGKADVDAYQFGLGNVFTDENGIAGLIQLNPNVQHIGSDMLLYYVHNKDKPGIFFKLHIPLGAMVITPNFTEPIVTFPEENLGFTEMTTSAPGNPASEITYEFTNYPTPYRRQQSMSEAFFGGVFNDGFLRGNISKPIRLRKARIAPTKQTIIRLADITVSLGGNVLVHENGFFGVAFKVSCPTGNLPTADYMLEPIFGRAGAWGLGAEITGSWDIWKNNAGNKVLTLWIQGEVLHLVPGRGPNWRTFDLKLNGPGSKYLLIQNYLSTYNNPYAAPYITFEQQTAFGIEPAANHTTMPVISSIDVEASLAAMLAFNKNNWNISVAGEFWGRSKEVLDIDFVSAVSLRAQNINDFAVIGRQFSNIRIDGQPGNLALYYCEPAAHIGKSLDPLSLVGSVPNVTPPATLPSGIADARIASNRIPQDLYQALDICGAAATKVFTGKLSLQGGYTWADHCHTPSLGLISGIEFTSNTNNAIELWSIGLQASINF